MIAFIRELNAMPYNNSAQDRMRALGDFWPEIQDATARLLTRSTAGKDRDPVPYLYLADGGEVLRRAFASECAALHRPRRHVRRDAAALRSCPELSRHC